MSQELDRLMDESKVALFAFLNTEADIGKTFASLAKKYLADGNTEHYEVDKRNAVKALETIDRFMDRLAPDSKSQIEARRSELARVISTLP